MTYSDIPGSPSAAAGQPNATDAAASSIRQTTWPYKRHADRAIGPRIALRPPDVPASTSDDPDMIAVQETHELLREIQHSTRLISAPWLIEPPDSESFHIAQGIVIPAQDGNFHVVASVLCPAGRNGVLKAIANVVVGGGWSDFSGDAIWQLVRNPGTGITTAERNYQNILASLGSIAAPARISGIRLFENDLIQFVIQNVALPIAGEEVGALLSGYFYPRTWDDVFERRAAQNAW